MEVFVFGRFPCQISAQAPSTLVNGLGDFAQSLKVMGIQPAARVHVYQLCVLHHNLGGQVYHLFWYRTQLCLLVNVYICCQCENNFGFLTLKDGTDRLSRNVWNYHYMLRNLLEERRFHNFRTLYIQLSYPATCFGRFLPSSGSFDNNVPPLKMGAIGCPETSVTTNARCVTSRQTEDLKA